MSALDWAPVPILWGLHRSHASYLVDFSSWMLPTPVAPAVETDPVLRETNARRNASRPLLRLPIEIIATVLSLLADIHPAVRYTGPGSRSKLGWIGVTHVCQRLRNVVLAMPLLWARHVSYFPQPAARQTILERARDVPLDLYVGWHSGAPEKAFALLHAKRARALISLNGGPMAGQSMPVLETLFLDRIGKFQRITAPPLVAPRLRKLVFRNVIVRWTAADLRSLAICMDRNPLALPSPQEFLTLGRCFSLWRCLSVPRADAGLQVLIDIHPVPFEHVADAAGEQVLPFFQLLAADLCGGAGSGRGSQPPIRQLVFDDAHSTTTTSRKAFALDLDDGTKTGRDPFKPFAHTIEIQCMPRDVGLLSHGTLAHGAVACPRKRVETLAIGLDALRDAFTAPRWSEILGHVAGVRNLHIAGPFRCLVDALSAASGGRAAALLPALEFLRVSRMALSAAPNRSPPQCLHMLASRAAAGVGIRRMQVDTACDVGDEHAKAKAKALVPTLAWGGGDAGRPALCQDYASESGSEGCGSEHDREGMPEDVGYDSM
ncbi:hypothetical protein OF83DRAFT_1173906 [Amylostereum chailletii]|nr:hypothetical protein OF83DRAFT_1173906 [Amylostereum chailletii]